MTGDDPFLDADRPLQGDGITDFHDRTAFVTGGARGIGLGIVRALVRRGVRVAVADVDQRALDEVPDKLAEETRHLVRCYRLDVSDREQYAVVGTEVRRDLGHVSLLFNNAGVIDSVSPSKMSYEMWDHVMGINLHGVYHGLQTFLPAMLASDRRSHVVNTTSEAGLLTPGSGFLYHASKFGVVGLTDSMRAELAHFEVGVSLLSPGPVATDIVENARRLRPAEEPRHSSRITEILDVAHQHLKSFGADPDAVGELVLDAVERNEPYIATRNETAGLVLERARQLVAAMDHAQTFLDRYASAPAPAATDVVAAG